MDATRPPHPAGTHPPRPTAPHGPPHPGAPHPPAGEPHSPAGVTEPARASRPAGPPPPLRRRLLPPLGTLAGVAAAFAYVGTVDPNEPGHYPACPLLRYTGLYCPGCGGLRSAHAFVHGDLAGALGANAMAVAGYAAFAVLMVWWLVRAVRGRPSRLDPAPWQLWLIGGVWAVFTVVRNLPFGSALAP
ncbi:DUF2752 domain-containing protein [Streptomyces kanasensis]|uniref:DUF2752 domain-containing protein n=1 Tax=Streptomyces kanasensis TaxID=936756 RepID=UPI0036F5E778